MKLIFFDECKPQPDSPYYHIGAVSIDEADAFAIEDEIAQIAQDVFGDSKLCSATEFHAINLFHRKKNFNNLRNHVERIGIFQRFLAILSKPEVSLIMIQINASLLSAGQNAADIAFMFLCERANDLVRSQKSIGMLIGDRESDRMSERFSTSMSRYRAKGTDFAFGRDIKNLFESVHFTQSHLSRFLQLADVYSWLLQFQAKPKNPENSKHQILWDSFKGKNLNPSKYKIWPLKSAGGVTHVM